MHAPAVSIITPTFNHFRYLRICIDSVLDQTFEDWELIILDDGSTDGTAEIALSYKDPRIRYFRQKRKGLEKLSETYNRGLRLARAPLIAVLEGDDLWPREKLAIQVPALRETHAVLSYGIAGLIDGSGKQLAIAGRIPVNPSVRSNRPPGLILKSLLFHNFIVSSTSIIRRNALERIGGFRQAPHGWCVDYPTYLHLSLVGEFVFVPQVLGFWRRHLSQHTATNARELMRNGRLCARAFFESAIAEGKLPSWLLYLDKKLGRFERVAWDYALLLDGRAKLLGGDWSGARRVFRSLLFTGRSALRAVGIVGVAASIVRKDLEWLARLAGVQPWR